MKDLAGQGEPAPAPFLLRMSCADLAPEALSVRLGFLTKHYIVDFPGKKQQKASILRPIDTPEGTILHSTCHITSEQAGHFLKTNASNDLESDQRASQKGRIYMIQIIN